MTAKQPSLATWIVALGTLVLFTVAFAWAFSQGSPSQGRLGATFGFGLPGLLASSAAGLPGATAPGRRVLFQAVFAGVGLLCALAALFVATGVGPGEARVAFAVAAVLGALVSFIAWGTWMVRARRHRRASAASA